MKCQYCGDVKRVQIVGRITVETDCPFCEDVRPTFRAISAILSTYVGRGLSRRKRDEIVDRLYAKARERVRG